MKLFHLSTWPLFLLALLCLSHLNSVLSQEDDFSEFEDPTEPKLRSPTEKFDTLSAENVRAGQEENVQGSKEKTATESKGKHDILSDDDGVAVEEEEEESDEEEFDDNSQETDKTTSKKSDKNGPATDPKQKTISITNIPFHLRNNWSSYYVEFAILSLLVLYFVNFFSGCSKNKQISNDFLENNREELEKQFSMVGDDGSNQFGRYIKDSENFYTLWCTGKNGLECLIFELRLFKRQDLLQRVINLFKPSADELVAKVFLNEDSMDNYVFCLANRRTGLKQMREMNDVQTYCTQRKNERLGIESDDLVLLNEIGDVFGMLFDNFMLNFVNQNDDLINYIHISDQFSGPKLVEDTPPTKRPDVKKVITLSFKLPNDATSTEGIEKIKQFVQFTFYVIEKVKRLRLKKDMKLKSQKNRQKVEEIFQKATHALRQEAAQLKREEKRRLEKEKILEENDQYKLRKLEEKEHKRELKRKAPKMKQLKVKAM